MNDVDRVEADIKNLKIQGATNVALAVLDAMEEFPLEAEAIGKRLAYARPTEPLAQNAIRYVFADPSLPMLTQIRKYRACIEEAKRTIPIHGQQLVVDGGSYLTLCHSSTTIALFGQARARGIYFSLFVAETRPLYQGRITASELLQLGFDDVTMIIDDVAVSLIEGRKGAIDAVFIGADLLSDAGFINKVGSLAVTAAAERKHIPVYSMTTLLKYDPRPYEPRVIETRNTEEIWEDAPDKLKFYAPAFDFVPYYRNVHLVCEAGVVDGQKVKDAVAKRYPFIIP